MVRLESVYKYEEEVRTGLQEFFNLCRNNMVHDGDLLLCQQNGFIFKDGNAYVGLGEEGLNSMQILNSISFEGIGETTDDNEYFTKNGDKFHQGGSEFENGIYKQKSTYLNIWENGYFLRIFTQLVNILNGRDYDWHLDISKLPPNGKSKHIREKIIKGLNLSPKFQQIIKTAYVGQIRNAIAHSQYHCIQGGIIYDNFNRDKYAKLEGLSFDDWEQKYIFSYFIFIGLFQTLKQIKDQFYLPVSKITTAKGIPVKVPCKYEGSYVTYLYPNEKDDKWHFYHSNNLNQQC